jgi:hypothetical protein
MHDSVAKFFRGDKRRREMDRKRRWDEKQKRLQQRREMRARGLDPDLVDEDGNPLSPQAISQSGTPRGGEASGGVDADGGAEDQDSKTDDVEEA